MKPAYHVVLLAIFLTSCTSLPDPQGTKAGESVAFPLQYGTASYEELEVKSGLVNLFKDDPLLTNYMSRTLQNNPTLQASAAALEEAGFNLKRTNAGRFPLINLNTSASRSKGVFGSNSVTFSSFQATLDASWEIDVWGRIRAGVRAASYDEKAAQADFKAAQESLIAQTAQAYFNALAGMKTLNIAKDELASLEETYQFTERQMESGSGSLAEVELAKSDLRTAQATVEETKDSFEQSARALSVLTGQSPTLMKTATDFPTLGRAISAGLPSNLLLKRPDIQAAYLRILAADERVKIAHKDLFPSFSLTGSYGRESNTLSDLLNGNAWSIGAGLAAPLFDGGALKAELGASNARAKAALADYRATVITALEEVENALGAEHYLRKQQELTQEALASARKAEERTRRQFESGLTDLPTLLETQRRIFTSERSLLNISLLRYQNRVALALALGKGL